MGEELISIIVPVYNAEQYLGDCIKSVLKQTYTHFELILVEDGSTDNSREICRRVGMDDIRISLVRQERNQGVSRARNAGIEAAKGKYLFFLDSDDTIHPRLIETLYKIMEKEGAAIATEFYCYDGEKMEGAPGEKRSENLDGYLCLDNQTVMEEFMNGTRGGFTGIGGKMLRRDALDSVRFDENLICGEDTKFIYQLLANGLDALVLNEDWYYYRRHEACASKKNTVRQWKSRYESLRYICDQEKEYGREKNVLRWENYIIKCMIDWERESRQSKDSEKREYLRDLAHRETEFPAFSAVSKDYQRSFRLLFTCYPLYVIDRRITDLFRRKEQIREEKKQKEQRQRWERQKMLLELRRLQQENEAADRIRKERAKNREKDIEEATIEEAAEEKKLYQEKISVIIPMYNTESYIRQCIRSLRNQTYDNIEIIVVDDGSTDKGAAICRELKGYDDRIQLIVQENKGVSAARNAGLEIATGKYVFFLDSDDAIHPLLFEELICQAEEFEADIALCEYEKQHAIWMERVLKELSVKDIRPVWQIVEQEESEEWIHMKYASALMRVGALVNRELVGELRFDENLIYGEDTLFMYRLVCKGVRIAYSDKAWYYYRMHTESVTHSMDVMKDKRYFNIYRILRDGEAEREHKNFAMTWERRLVWLMRQKYMLMKQNKDEEGCRLIRGQALTEKEHPLFQELTMMPKLLFLCCFSCYPLYYFVLEKPAKDLDKFVWAIKSRHAS